MGNGYCVMGVGGVEFTWLGASDGDVGCVEKLPFDHRSDCSLSDNEVEGLGELPSDGRALLASARHEARRRGSVPTSRSVEIDSTAKAAERFGWQLVPKAKNTNMFKFGQAAASASLSKPTVIAENPFQRRR